jgi:hypothetical protein
LIGDGSRVGDGSAGGVDSVGGVGDGGEAGLPSDEGGGVVPLGCPRSGVVGATIADWDAPDDGDGWVEDETVEVCIGRPVGPPSRPGVPPNPPLPAGIEAAGAGVPLASCQPSQLASGTPAPSTTTKTPTTTVVRRRSTPPSS